MKSRDRPAGETPEQTAESISDALDFLRGEAEAAGLTEVGELIRQASNKAKEQSAYDRTAPFDDAAALLEACKAIVRLPADYRKALIFKKVYRRSYAEIADDCQVSVATAKDWVADGFRQVRSTTNEAGISKSR